MEKQPFVNNDDTQIHGKEEKKIREILDDILNNYSSQKIPSPKHEEMQLNCGKFQGSSNKKVSTAVCCFST